MDATCKKTCDGKCEVLENLLLQETEALHRYERLIKMCDYPEVQAFLQNLLVAKQAFQARIIAKIDELQVQSETAHHVMDSFDGFSW
jgi:Mn-containing catalase